MVSTDKKIFEKNSAVKRRILEYGKLVEKMEVIVLATSKKSSYQKKILESNVVFHSTNSKSKLFYIWNAVHTGKKIIKQWNKKGESNEKILITAQDPFETGLIAWLIARTSNIKLQIQVHTDFLSDAFRKSSFKNAFRVNLAQFILPKASGIRVVSERIKTSIEKKYPRLKIPIIILPIFVDIKEYEDKIPSFDLHKKYPQFDFVVLTVARLEPEKNLISSIDVMREVIDINPKTGYVLVGEGSLRKSLEERVKAYGVSENIIFEGWQNDLISYYKTADLFLFTSDYEGYGLSLVEAASSGCPIITSDVGVVGGILKKDGVKICQSRNKRCFVEGILDFKKDGLDLYNKSIKAREYIEKGVIKNKQEHLEKMKQSWEQALNS